MANRYNMVIPIPTSSGQTYWHKIGAGFVNNKGQISLVFNSLPCPVESNGKWETRAYLFEVTENDQPRPQKEPAPPQWSKALDDEIPF